MKIRTKFIHFTVIVRYTIVIGPTSASNVKSLVIAQQIVVSSKYALIAVAVTEGMNVEAQH